MALDDNELHHERSAMYYLDFHVRSTWVLEDFLASSRSAEHSSGSNHTDAACTWASNGL